MGAGTGTFRQAAGAAPPDGAALVVLVVLDVGLTWESDAVALGAPEPVLLLPLLPQPATTRTMATARHALRTEL